MAKRVKVPKYIPHKEKKPKKIIKKIEKFFEDEKVPPVKVPLMKEEKQEEIKTKEEDVEKVDLNKELKITGIILIILGLLHFILSGFLDFTWGLVLIPIGVIALFYRSRKMVLILGILLILLGVWNFYINIENSIHGSSSTFVTLLSFFQIYWGIKEIIRFRKIKENPKYLVKETNKKGFVWYALRVGLVLIILDWLLTRIFSSRIQSFFTNLSFANVILLVSLEGALFFFVLIMSIISLVKYKKKDFAFLAFGVSVILILLTSYALIYVNPNQYEFPNQHELSPNYAEFILFTDQYSVNEIKLEFNSSLPIDVYVVPSKEDYDKFMDSEKYNTYLGCSFMRRTYGIIDCNVSSGGLIIYNPNYESINYTIN